MIFAGPLRRFPLTKGSSYEGPFFVRYFCNEQSALSLHLHVQRKVRTTQDTMLSEKGGPSGDR